MAPLNATFNASLASFSVDEALPVLIPLAILIIGIFVYAWFIFKFYRFLASKDIFKLNLRRYGEEGVGFFGAVFRGILYTLEYLLIFPLFVFFWFLVISIFIGLISTRPFADVLIASMGLVAATRIAAYYDEDLSKDLAKMIPFALLGIFIIDVKLISFEVIIGMFWNVIDGWKNIVYYLILVIMLELILRVFSSTIGLFRKAS